MQECLLAMIILTEKDFLAVNCMYVCVFLHTFFAKNLGVFSNTPCALCERISRKLDEKFFKAKAYESAQKKGVVLFPSTVGLHPFLTLYREVSAIIHSQTSAQTKDARP
jgi:hypothetical protein